MNNLIDKMEYCMHDMTDEISKYVDESFSDGNKVLCAYHCDFGGIPSQVCMNKIARKVGFRGLHSSYITFESTKFFKKRLRKENFDEIMFLDFEPHSDIYGAFEHVERVGVFGHHPLSDYMNELEKDDKVTYFNPKKVIPKNLKYRKTNRTGTDKRTVYRRGTPIFLPISLAAEKMDADTSFVTSLGLRGYGFGELANSYEQKKNMDVDYKRARSTNKAISMLFSYRFEYTKDITKKLTDINGYDDHRIKWFTNECYNKNIYNTADTLCSEVISESESFGNDIAVFPIRNNTFDQIKAVVGEIETTRRSREKWPVRIYIDMTDKNSRKFSVRTNPSIDGLGLIKHVFENIDVEERNYGGHKNAAGIKCTTADTPKILRSLVTEYYAGDVDKEMLEEKVALFNGIPQGQKTLF